MQLANSLQLWNKHCECGYSRIGDVNSKVAICRTESTFSRGWSFSMKVLTATTISYNNILLLYGILTLWNLWKVATKFKNEQKLGRCRPQWMVLYAIVWLLLTQNPYSCWLKKQPFVFYKVTQLTPFKSHSLIPQGICSSFSAFFINKVLIEAVSSIHLYSAIESMHIPSLEMTHKLYLLILHGISIPAIQVSYVLHVNYSGLQKASFPGSCTPTYDSLWMELAYWAKSQHSAYSRMILSRVSPQNKGEETAR